MPLQSCIMLRMDYILLQNPSNKKFSLLNRLNSSTLSLDSSTLEFDYKQSDLTQRHELNTRGQPNGLKTRPIGGQNMRAEQWETTSWHPSQKKTSTCTDSRPEESIDADHSSELWTWSESHDILLWDSTHSWPWPRRQNVSSVLTVYNKTAE